MNACVLGFQDIDKTKLAMVGGKGANLGELSRIDGIRVPEGFCVTTEAYKRIIGQTPAFHALLEQLSLLKVQNRERIREISGKIRSAIEGTAIAKDAATFAGNVAQSPQTALSPSLCSRNHISDDSETSQIIRTVWIEFTTCKW
jgi:hypothetical protein